MARKLYDAVGQHENSWHPVLLREVIPRRGGFAAVRILQMPLNTEHAFTQSIYDLRCFRLW